MYKMNYIIDLDSDDDDGDSSLLSGSGIIDIADDEPICSSSVIEIVNEDSFGSVGCWDAFEKNALNMASTASKNPIPIAEHEDLHYVEAK